MKRRTFIKGLAGFIDAGSGRTVFINRALGCSYQVRFNVRPEIMVFTLQSAQEFRP